MRLLYIALLLSALSFGQDRNGISYQALILNPQGEQLPGANNNTVPMANTEVCLRFHITTNAGSYNEYSERQVLTTDAYGMINTVVGTGVPVGTIMWNQIVWTEDSKGLKVEIDYSGDCSSFVALSSQELTSVPFALYSPASNIPGPPGEAGDSAYQLWIDEGNTGTEQEFLDSLKGTDGEPGDPGADGDSAYQVWIDEGNTGTEQEFLDSLKGTDGDPGEGTEGKSAYEVWIELGNTGTEQDFIASLSGPKGDPGLDGVKSLIKTSLEESGSNCINGGVKIEVGEDANADGVLDTDEVDDSLTKYVCNGADGEGGSGLGIGNFSGEDLVPEDVIYMADQQTSEGSVETYVVPAGKYAKISSILPHTGYPEEGIDAIVMPNRQTNTYFTINSEIVYPLATRISDTNMQQMFSSDFYFPSETSISIENPSNQYGGITQLGFFVEIYSLNNFLPKLVSTSQPVPEGKKWKVVNFLSSAPLTAPNQQAALTGGSNSIIINGFEVLSNGGDYGNMTSSSEWDIVRLAKGSFWIPEGTTLAPGANTYAVNVLEFDSELSSGIGSGGSVGSGSGLDVGEELQLQRNLILPSMALSGDGKNILIAEHNSSDAATERIYSVYNISNNSLNKIGQDIIFDVSNAFSSQAASLMGGRINFDGTKIICHMADSTTTAVITEYSFIDGSWQLQNTYNINDDLFGTGDYRSSDDLSTLVCGNKVFQIDSASGTYSESVIPGAISGGTFNYSISSDGNTVQGNTYGGPSTSIKVFKKINNAWVQQGQDILPPSNYNGNAFAYRGDLSDDGLKFVAPWYYYPDLNYTVYSYFENQWIASETIKNTFWTDGAIFDANGEYLVTIGNELISDYNYLKCSVYKFTDGSWNIEKSSFTELGTPPSINSIL
jgi:hypothetical protein